MVSCLFSTHAARNYRSRIYSKFLELAPAREACSHPFAETGAALKFALRIQNMGTWRSSTVLHECTNIWNEYYNFAVGRTAIQFSRYAHANMNAAVCACELINFTFVRAHVCVTVCVCGVCMCVTYASGVGGVIVGWFFASFTSWQTCRFLSLIIA